MIAGGSIVPRRCAPAPVGGDDIFKTNPSCRRGIWGTVEKSLAVGKPHATHLLHALSRAAACSGRRGTRSSPRPTDGVVAPVELRTLPRANPRRKRGKAAGALRIPTARGIPGFSSVHRYGPSAISRAVRRESIDTRRLASNAAVRSPCLGPRRPPVVRGRPGRFLQVQPRRGRRDGRGEARLRPVRVRPRHLGFWVERVLVLPPAYPDDAAERRRGETRAVRGGGRREDAKMGNDNAGGRERTGGSGATRSAPLRAASTTPEPPSERISSPGSSSTPRSGRPRRRRISLVPVRRRRALRQRRVLDAAILSWIASHPGAAREDVGGWWGGRWGGDGTGSGGREGDGTGRRGGRGGPSHYSRRAQVVMKS